MEELEEEDYSNQKASLNTWKQIIHTVFLDKFGAIGMIISVVIESLIDILYPLLNKFALENYFINEPKYDSLKWFIPLYIIVCILFGLSSYSFLRFVGRIQIHTAYSLRKQSFEQLQKLSFSYLLLSSITKDLVVLDPKNPSENLPVTSLFTFLEFL